MGGAPQTVVWRGVRLDPDTADMLAAVARDVGDDIYVRPIQGSYSVSTAASAGTHDGGGAFDLDCEGLTDAQARRLETECRKKGSAAWFRPRYSPSGVKYGWQRHVHGLRLDCPDLAVSARVQTVAYFGGLDGLASQRADTGSRLYVTVRWLDLARNIAAQIIEAAQEDDVTPEQMQQILDAIAAANKNAAWAQQTAKAALDAALAGAKDANAAHVHAKADGVAIRELATGLGPEVANAVAAALAQGLDAEVTLKPKPPA